MSTQFTNRQWRLPNNENKDKQSNYSMDFDGSSHIKATTTYSSTFSEFSVSFWVNPATIPSSNEGLFAFSQINGTTDFQSARGRFTSTGKFQVLVLSGGWIESGVKTAGSWYNVILTVNTSGYNLYINGTLEATSTTINQSSYIGDIYIGARLYSSAPQDYFNGLIDGFSIFDYALSTSQITTLYGSSSTGIGNPMSLSPKPVAYYPLGDQDAFNGANYLVPNSSLKDYVFNFNGSNDYIDCGSVDETEGITTMSLSGWFKPDTTGVQGAAGIIAKESRDWYVGWYSSPVNSIRFLISNDNGVTKDSINSLTLGTDANVLNKWHHFVCTWDASDKLKIYINGVFNSETNSVNANSALPTSTNIVEIGRRVSSYFNGKISNVQIFNTALPATGSNSVETLYNNGSPLTSMSGFTSLQGWWKLDASATYDGSNWTIEDSSSNSNDGTSSGMTQANLVQSDLSFTSGYSPYALDFDAASGDYIDCGNDVSLRVTPNLTVSAWFKTSTSQIGKLINRDGLASGTRDYALYQNATNLQFWVSQSGNITETVLTSTGFTANDGNWHHAVGVCNGTNIELYIDGVLNVSGTNSIAGINTSTYINEIGSRTTGTGNFFNGSLSNFSIWNAALTSSQVTEIYNEGVPSNLNNHSAYSNLVSWWQLGSNSSFNTNWTVLDEVAASGNNGTSSNMGEDAIVDGVGSYANGLSSGMSDNIVGSAPFSDANSLSVNMDVLDRSTDVPN